MHKYAVVSLPIVFKRLFLFFRAPSAIKGKLCRLFTDHDQRRTDCALQSPVCMASCSLSKHVIYIRATVNMSISMMGVVRSSQTRLGLDVPDTEGTGESCTLTVRSDQGSHGKYSCAVYLAASHNTTVSLYLPLCPHLPLSPSILQQIRFSLQIDKITVSPVHANGQSIDLRLMLPWPRLLQY